MGNFRGFCLHHHPDQGLGAGGTDENAALAAQFFLPAAGLLMQGFIGHDTLLDPGGVGNLHVDKLLGVLGASGGQLGGGDAAAAEGLQKLQSRKTGVFALPLGRFGAQ